MSNMWKGPSAAVLATHTDPLCRRLHRRAGEQNITYTLNDSGTRAEVSRLEKRGSSWFFVPLGTVEAEDPLGLFIAVAREYTEHDHELFVLIASLNVRRLEMLTYEIEDRLKEVTGIASVLSGELGKVRSRYV